MTEENAKEKPAYKGSLDVALWKKTDKDGNIYFSLKIGQYANLFENKVKAE